MIFNKSAKAIGSPGDTVVKNPSANAGDTRDFQVGFLGQEDPLEEEVVSLPGLIHLSPASTLQWHRLRTPGFNPN